MRSYLVDGYTHALQLSMPLGLAWPKIPSSTQTLLLSALASSFQLSDEDANRLLMGAFPKTATIRLTEWEKL